MARMFKFAQETRIIYWLMFIGAFVLYFSENAIFVNWINFRLGDTFVTPVRIFAVLLAYAGYLVRNKRR